MRISDWSSDVCSSDLALLPIALAAIAIYPKARDVASDGVGIVGALVDVVDERREHAGPRLVGGKAVAVDIIGVDPGGNRRISAESDRMPVLGTQTAVLRPPGAAAIRSEEHTSELQSLMRISYAFFCLKKKIKKQ